MTALYIPEGLRAEDKFHHIDMGFLNRRLCISALSSEVRGQFFERQKPGTDHMTRVVNDHLLVEMLLDFCEATDVPTLLKALTLGKPDRLFRSTERLEPCPKIHKARRVCHAVKLDFDFGKLVSIAYHTSHIFSDTGMLILKMGSPHYPANSIVGLLHDKPDHFEIEPLVIGQPWFDHGRNGEDSRLMMVSGHDFGEILPEDHCCPNKAIEGPCNMLI